MASDKLPKVLIVDDEPLQRQWISLSLRRADWIVIEAENGLDAIDLVIGSRPALVLMDVQLPGLDGFETTARIRAIESGAGEIPILAFTATPVGDGDSRFFAADMDGYIVKPSSPGALAEALEHWRPGPMPSALVELGKLIGEHELGGMLDRFRGSLVEALAALKSEEGRAARAHRLAGIAGTLGFADVYESWLALSEGHDSALPEARATARKALVRIERMGANAATV